MPSKIEITVTKGSLAGEKFSYDRRESLILGRNEEDCRIVFSEPTVSRYHCLLDINPPTVMVRDFGSLNGTYLNGQQIGKRDASLSIEEAKKQHYDEFPLKSGDRLGLGKDSELTLKIITAEKAKRNQCVICGATLSGNLNESNICPECTKGPLKFLNFLLRQAKKGVDDAREIAGYKNIRLLGKGSMGEVWLVQEEATGKEIALKLMLPEVAGDELSRKMFLREAYISGALKHENVVTQDKCGRLGDAFFILMELCRGGSVDDLFRKHGGKLDMALATSIILQTLDGLHYTHNATVAVTLKDGETISATGVVHRDFKPGNIFLTGDLAHPTAKVADFGLAKAFDAAGLTSVTKPRDIRGTIVYMSRQQIIDCRNAKPEVDVWAAAASYYYLLTGFYAKDFRGRCAAELINEALSKDPIPILNRNLNIPEKLAEVIDMALKEKPQIEIRSALELKERIWKALPSDLKKKVLEIVPPFTKKIIETEL
jgi:serine/threonine protein kinase